MINVNIYITIYATTYNLHMNSFICGSSVVIMVSTELLAFSATFARIDLPGIASFIHPNSPEPTLVGSSVVASWTSFTCTVGLSKTAVSRVEIPTAGFWRDSLSEIGDIGRRIGRFLEPYNKRRKQ